MAMVGFDERLTRDAVLPQMIRDTLGLEGTAVYPGRRFKNEREPVEVLISWDGPERRARGGGDQVWEHKHQVSIAVMGVDDPDGAGGRLLREVERKATMLTAQLDGQRPFFAELPDVKHHKCEPTRMDDDPEDSSRVIIQLTLWSYTQGQGYVFEPDTFGGS